MELTVVVKLIRGTYLRMHNTCVTALDRHSRCSRLMSPGRCNILTILLMRILLSHFWYDNIEPTALGGLKVRCYAEVPQQDELLSLLSIYGYQLAIGYFGVVKRWGRQLSKFSWWVRGWGLLLAVWTPLWEVVSIWLASGRGEIAARILRGGYPYARGMSRR
jgi:hypothetical protein